MMFTRVVILMPPTSITAFGQPHKQLNPEDQGIHDGGNSSCDIPGWILGSSWPSGLRERLDRSGSVSCFKQIYPVSVDLLSGGMLASTSCMMDS